LGVSKLEQKDYERIAKLETQLESLTEGLKRIEKKLDEYTTNFITRTEADIRFKNIEKELREVKEDKRANRAFWVSVSALAVTFIFSLLNYLKG
jgi:seryl-tRNA synthetase